MNTGEIRDAILGVETAMRESFRERDDVIRGLLFGLLTGTNVFILGPRGTGKSLLVRHLCAAIEGSYFELLMDPSSRRDEMFGVVDPAAHLERAELRYNTTGMLPEAHVAFLDEIWKANGAVLNSLLGVLNERAFRNGPVWQRTNLQTVIGASNELPSDDDEINLDPLYDRFLLRYAVDYIADEGAWLDLVLSGTPKAPAKALSVNDVLKARVEMSRVKLGSLFRDALTSVRASLRGAGFELSDRRWLLTVNQLCRASAWLSGRDEADETDLEVLVDSAWDEPGQRAALALCVTGVTNPLKQKALRFVDAANTAVADVEVRRDGETDHQWAARIAEACTTLREVGSRAGELSAANPGPKGDCVRDAATRIADANDRLGRKAADLMGIRSIRAARTSSAG